MDTTLSSGPRRANLVDSMILILAIAVGLALASAPLVALREWFAMIKPAYRTESSIWWDSFTRKLGPQFLVMQGLVQLVACFVVPLTPALLISRLRRPRPPLRLLACQPGFAASVALCLTSLIAVDLSVMGLVSIPPLVGMTLPGAAVLTSWMALVVTRCWRPEPGWIDRAGRAVGAFWVATLPWSIWVAT